MNSKLQMVILLVENGFLVLDPDRNGDITDPMSYFHRAKNDQGIYIGDFLEEQGFTHQIRTDDLNGEVLTFHDYKNQEMTISFRDLEELWRGDFSSRQTGDYSTQFIFR